MKYFKLEEFKCPCCGKCEMDARLLERLDDFRAAVGVPMTVNSGFRCPAQNEKDGGAENSYHLKGLAADISLAKYPTDLKHRAFKLAFAMFDGVGVAKTFVHVDLRGTKATWVY